MKKGELNEKDNKLMVIADDNEFDFLQYQEMLSRQAEAKRNRRYLNILSWVIYFLGLGLISGISINIYNMYKYAGIGIGAVLFILFTIFFICLIGFIKKKQGFDLEFKKHYKHKYSEIKNNILRWTIAKNIIEQSVECKSLYSVNFDGEDFDNIKRILDKEKGHIPSYKAKESIELGDSLAVILKKGGKVYSTSQKMIWREAVRCGTLTAISQSAVLDAGIVVVKNLQLIKNIIWLYGFRPTDFEMNRIFIKVIRNVCLSIGLNTIPSNGVTVASKILSKDSSNFIVQMLGSAFNLGAQFLGNGVMTYLIGKHTVSVMLKEYRMEEVFRKEIQNDDEMEIEVNASLMKDLNGEIKEQLKNNGEEKTK